MATYNGQMQDSSSNILLPTPHSMATIETGTTASQAYAIGDSLVYNNQLCKVTKAIASGGALTIGTNIAYNNVGAISKQLVASDGTEFYFDVLNGDYGYYPSAAKVASKFVKFGGSTAQATYSLFMSHAGGSASLSGTTSSNTITVYAFVKYMKTPSAILTVNGTSYNIPRIDVSPTETYGHCEIYKLTQSCPVNVPFSINISVGAVASTVVNTTCGIGIVVI